MRRGDGEGGNRRGVGEGGMGRGTGTRGERQQGRNGRGRRRSRVGWLASPLSSEAALGQVPGTSKPCLHEGSWPVASHQGDSMTF